MAQDGGSHLEIASAPGPSLPSLSLTKTVVFLVQDASQAECELPQGTSQLCLPPFCDPELPASPGAGSMFRRWNVPHLEHHGQKL